MSRTGTENDDHNDSHNNHGDDGDGDGDGDGDDDDSTLCRSLGEHGRARMPRLSSLPLENSTLIAVAPEDRAALCNASRA